MRGIYALILFLPENKQICIGALGKIDFRKGFYCYIGSAQNNLEKRLQRHLKLKKKKKWHIDYFREHAEVKAVFIKINAKKEEECESAKVLKEFFIPVPRFGCSDCSCKSHLFYSPNFMHLKKILLSLGLEEHGMGRV